MKDNQLHLIKRLESKVKDLIKVFKDPEKYNSNIASKEKLQRLEEKVTTLEKEVKKILYAIGK